jgi:hypothetical protein
MSGECDIRATVGDNRAKLAGQDRDFCSQGMRQLKKPRLPAPELPRAGRSAPDEQAQARRVAFCSVGGNGRSIGTSASRRGTGHRSIHQSVPAVIQDDRARRLPTEQPVQVWKSLRPRQGLRIVERNIRPNQRHIPRNPSLCMERTTQITEYIRRSQNRYFQV